MASPQSSKKGDRRKVFIVDDHPIVREGIVELINRQDDLVVSGQAEGGYEALRLMGADKPDVAVVDISLKDINGLQLIKNLKSKYGKLPVLVLSMHDEFVYGERAFRVGAQGYVMKKEASKNVLAAIRRVLDGEVYMSNELAARMMQRLVVSDSGKLTTPVDQLSDREFEVFQWIGKGLKSKQIAEKMHLSTKTIATYREHIKEKLQLKNTADVVSHAIEWVHSGNAAEN